MRFFKGGLRHPHPVHHLVGTAEVADMLGVSQQRVHQLAQREDFPPPVVILSEGSRRIWERAAIERWMTDTGRGADEL